MIIDLCVNLETPDGGRADPADLAQASRAAGLDGLVLCQLGVPRPDIEPYAAAADGLLVVPGGLLPTAQGLLLTLLPEGAPSERLVPGEDGLFDAEALISEVESLKGVTVALRPYDREVPHPMGDHLFALAGLAACETWNGAVSEIANDLALEAASNLELPCVGTSGARGTVGLGKTATLLRRPVTDIGGLIQLLEEGGCWPVGFSNEAPVDPDAGRPPRRDGDRRGPDRRPGRSRDRRGPDGRAPDRRPDARAPDRRGPEARGPEGRERPSGPRREGESSAGGRRDRRGPAGGERRSGPTRVISAPEHADRLPDDVGNRVSRNRRGPPPPPDDIGNRRGPGRDDDD